jgi:hypothetical protein
VGTLGADDIVTDAEANAKHFSGEELQGGKGLVLRGRSDMAPDRERSEECADLPLAHVSWVPALMEADEAANPSDVGFLGCSAELAGANTSANSVS